MEPSDYKNRTYLSAIEAAKFLGITVEMLHHIVNKQHIKAQIATSGQMRFDLKELKDYSTNFIPKAQSNNIDIEKVNVLEVNGTIQKIFIKNSMCMDEQEDNSIHLMITSPPYFDTKMYSGEPVFNDLGSIHNIDDCFEKIGKV